MGQVFVSELFRAYHRELVQLATRLMGDSSAGEEVAQDAYLRLIDGNIHVASIASPKAYLFRCARNIAFDARTRNRREWSRRVDIEDLSNFQDYASHPENVYDGRQQLQILADALNELPKACRTVFFLNRIDGLKHRVIAERLGISISMVEKHMVRAFIHCRGRLADRNIF